MISFKQGSEDYLLMSELREANILTPDIIRKIESSTPNALYLGLSELLISGAEHISESKWLTWLIRYKGCSRFGNVTWTDQARIWSYQGIPSDANFPYLLTHEQRGIVAVLRPDRLNSTAERLKALRPFWAAATLLEIKFLRKSWVEAYSRRPYEMTCIDQFTKTTDTVMTDLFNFDSSTNPLAYTLK
jgi:hypothetical protein